MNSILNMQNNRNLNVDLDSSQNNIMMDDFFKLDGNSEDHKEIATEKEFYTLLKHSKDLRDAMYMPDSVGDGSDFSTKKIEGTSFTNFSFKGTKFYKITFISCNFSNCILAWCSFFECEFIDCEFINANFHKSEFVQCLADPLQFRKAICWKEWSKSNIAVHLFDRLFRNAEETYRHDHARHARYQYRKWDTRLMRQKYFTQKPYAISDMQFFPSYIWQLIYKWTFGYGYRARNFVITFICTYLVAFVVNYKFWGKYDMKSKDVYISSFDADSVNMASNLFYTVDATTKLIDSQMQPTSDFGMSMLTAQSVLTFVLLSALITILANRFIGK